MTVAYNENDPFAAAWLRNLIAGGHIAPGVVLECSIEDLTAYELRGFTQFHAFAGIGVWSAALRGAGWPDDREVWTGSCPCQPFSAAGQGAGFADDRHLWPVWAWLIEQHRPRVILGEQVASKAALDWFDLVSTDLENQGYAVGASDLCAAGVGAPHIRQRLWWMGIANSAGPQQGRQSAAPLGHGRPTQSAGGNGQLVDAASEQARLPGRAREPGSASVALGDADTPTTSPSRRGAWRP